MKTSRKTRPVNIPAKGGGRHTGRCRGHRPASPQPRWQVIRRALHPCGCSQPTAALARPRRGDSRKADAVAYRTARSGAAVADLLRVKQPRIGGYRSPSGGQRKLQSVADRERRFAPGLPNLRCLSMASSPRSSSTERRSSGRPRALGTWRLRATSGCPTSSPTRYPCAWGGGPTPSAPASGVALAAIHLLPRKLM